MASCGFDHSIALNSKGQIYSWGRQVFNKKMNKKIKLNLDVVRPKKLNAYIMSDKGRVQVCEIFNKIITFGYQNAAINQKGLLYTWGENNFNCLAQKDTNDLNQPTCVQEL